ncbi:hypothetical protein MMAG44476_34846 [Mycolicibacterium mageritense DSM 44476 = CIP 104973]|uniref:DUF5642 domain-containing protein n=1 Tax=Mycolicibacterium mageritense TaxID=53462 RepID=A0ABM7HW86_MYCME|nr:hypothetical protein [Mycolicibacterium mageritense]MCC9183061.1 hypothetical protein [Mycolicibacterium mageritense]BBX34867.1 hypothetical protein MMAGJ_41490 [Mycolicibacterium mageritense]CDO20614.1 hypothetical protein BN978_01071 [Mycolicibacterium mageritense DSM 44476 = CIP 104973]
MLKNLTAGVVVFLVAAALLAGCRDEADAPTVTMDASLRPLLVTRSDFPSGWQVQDLSDEMSKNSGGTESGRAEPAQCDASDKTSLSSGVVAMVTKNQQKVPNVIVTIAREPGSNLVAVTEEWLAKCYEFSVDKGDVTAEVTVERMAPPPSRAAKQVGYRLESQAQSGGESVTVKFSGYTAEVGELVVMCIATGGDATGAGGKSIAPDVDMLNEVFAKQVAKVATTS